MQPTAGAPFIWPIRVYYEDTDAGGIVFFANYLEFFERARTEWLRSGGIDQSRLAASDNLMFVVVHTAVDYHSPAKLDNELKLSVVVERLGRASVEFVQQAWRTEASDAFRLGAEPIIVPNGAAGAAADQTANEPTSAGAPTPGTHACLLATGRIRVACVDQHTLRPRAIPDQIRLFALNRT
ncbi:MAG: YbgC/FadM family acyl-CoA thioesterase [Herminiimonas sp.]|nr:YbgC/FadM family acyl-CoA thioesterase [Herminiimonas sp.]